MEPCLPLEKQKFYLDLSYEEDGDKEDKEDKDGSNSCRYALMRTGTEETMATRSFFESLYTCFGDFRKLSLSEKELYLKKERNRFASSLHTEAIFSNPSTSILTKLGFSLRDLYYRMLERYIGNNKSEEDDPYEADTEDEEDEEEKDELDKLVDDVFERVPVEIFQIWMQLVSTSYFENVVKEWSKDVGKSGEGEKIKNCFIDKLFLNVIEKRCRKWWKKHDLEMKEEQEKKLFEMLSSFSEIFFQCACQWLMLYLRGLIKGEFDESDPMNEDSSLFIDTVSAYLPFDLILLNSKTLDVEFDSFSVLQKQGIPNHENIVCVLHFNNEGTTDAGADNDSDDADTDSTTSKTSKTSKTEEKEKQGCHRFESVGIIMSYPDKSQPTRLSRIFHPDDPLIISLRESQCSDEVGEDSTTLDKHDDKHSTTEGDKDQDPDPEDQEDTDNKEDHEDADNKEGDDDHEDDEADEADEDQEDEDKDDEEDEEDEDDEEDNDKDEEEEEEEE